MDKNAVAPLLIWNHRYFLQVYKRNYLVRVMISVAIEIRVPTDDIPNDSAGGTCHEERAFELFGST